MSADGLSRKQRAVLRWIRNQEREISAGGSEKER